MTLENENLNAFCDPARNYHNAANWPRHESCSGRTVIGFGTPRELIAPCECPCHHPFNKEHKRNEPESGSESESESAE